MAILILRANHLLSYNFLVRYQIINRNSFLNSITDYSIAFECFVLISNFDLNHLIMIAMKYSCWWKTNRLNWNSFLPWYQLTYFGIRLGKWIDFMYIYFIIYFDYFGHSLFQWASFAFEDGLRISSLFLKGMFLLTSSYIFQVLMVALQVFL